MPKVTSRRVVVFCSVMLLTAVVAVAQKRSTTRTARCQTSQTMVARAPRTSTHAGSPKAAAENVTAELSAARDIAAAARDIAEAARQLAETSSALHRIDSVPVPQPTSLPNATSDNRSVQEILSRFDDETLFAELRRRSLEAEEAVGSTEQISSAGGSADEPYSLPIPIADLDQMTAFPGNLAALPETVPHPDDNPPSAAKEELGKLLYFDRRLSRDNSFSCASCHNPELGWADGLPRSRGFGGIELGRHSPTVINTAFNTVQFWDGRAATLEHQAVGPIMAAGEMNMPSEAEVLHRITEAPEYKNRFESVFGEGVSMDNIGKAIAAFERTVVTGPSPFDRYMAGDKSALSDAEKRGLVLFMTTASCTACHQGVNFTDNKFHNLGVRQDGPLQQDDGRFAVTGDPKDRGAFKTPGLRNIEQSAPYMHDGSLATLEDVVAFYNKGGERSDNRSTLIQPLNLNSQQQADLVGFLRALTGPLPEVEVPVGSHFRP